MAGRHRVLAGMRVRQPLHRQREPEVVAERRAGAGPVEGELADRQPALRHQAGPAQARASVARARDTLDRFTLGILDALGRAGVDGGADVDAVLALTAAAHPAPDPATVRAALDRLRELFLVYGPEDELTVVPGVDEVTSPYPAGLGRPAAELDPAAAVLCADAAGLRRTVLAAPPPSRAVLDRLAAGLPIGSTTTGATADPDSAVGWLVERRLLVPTSETTVELPPRVGLLLRRDDR